MYKCNYLYLQKQSCVVNTPLFFSIDVRDEYCMNQDTISTCVLQITTDNPKCPNVVL